MKLPVRIFILLVLGMSVSKLQAQQNLAFSVHVSPQFAWLSSSDHDVVDPDGSIFHMQAGLQMDYFFQENYAFILGFGINNMGGKIHILNDINYGSSASPIPVDSGQSIRLNVQYLEIPLGLKLKTEELGYVTGFLQLGFNPMFAINGHISSDAMGYDKKNIYEESIRLFNIGYHVGLGAEYRLGGNTAVTGGIRWSSGLIDVTDNDGANLNTNAISIVLGVLF